MNLQRVSTSCQSVAVSENQFFACVVTSTYSMNRIRQLLSWLLSAVFIYVAFGGLGENTGGPGPTTTTKESL